PERRLYECSSWGDSSGADGSSLSSSPASSAISPQKTRRPSCGKNSGPASATVGWSGARTIHPLPVHQSTASRQSPLSFRVARTAFRSPCPWARRLLRKSSTAAARTGKSRIRSVQFTVETRDGSGRRLHDHCDALAAADARARDAVADAAAPHLLEQGQR